MLPLIPYNPPDIYVRRLFVLDHGGTVNITVYYKRTRGFRQKKPYNVFSPYTMIEQRLLSGMENANAWAIHPRGEKTWQLALNKARADFVGKLGDSAQFGSTMTSESKQTWGSIVTVITRMATAARHVKRLELFSAASALGLPFKEYSKRVGTRKQIDYISRRNGYGRTRVVRKIKVYKTMIDFGNGRSYVKSAASGWLMWSYGVKPLMTDVQAGMRTLTSELPAKLVTARGKSEAERIHKDGTTVYKTTSVTRVKTQAYVRVSNPNLWLANQMGLINPVQWLNEGIPFSFVIDWFSNLSQIINQMTDFAGLEIIEPCTMTKGTIVESRIGASPYSKQYVVFTRTDSIPRAKLLFGYERFSWQRGLNAISLLVGFLPGKR